VKAGDDPSVVSSGPMPDSEAAADYWTPERMREARPALPVLPGAPREAGDDESVRPGGSIEVPGEPGLP
jgi:hypothetical protein